MKHGMEVPGPKELIYQHLDRMELAQELKQQVYMYQELVYPLFLHNIQRRLMNMMEPLFLGLKKMNENFHILERESEQKNKQFHIKKDVNENELKNILKE